MAKVQRLSELSQSLPFTEYDFYDLYQKTFEGTVLGRMKKVLPLREMADTFGLVSKRQVPKRGARPYFTPEGKVALVFLKTYTQLSERMGVRRPRTKFLDVEKANLSYRKQRKHSTAKTRKMTRRLLNLLGKILKEIRRIEREHGGDEPLTVKEKSLVDTVTKVYRQQRNHFDSGNRRESRQDSERVEAVREAHRQGQGGEERGVRGEVQQHHGRRYLVH